MPFLNSCNINLRRCQTSRKNGKKSTTFSINSSNLITCQLVNISLQIVKLCVVIWVCCSKPRFSSACFFMSDGVQIFGPLSFLLVLQYDCTLWHTSNYVHIIGVLFSTRPIMQLYASRWSCSKIHDFSTVRLVILNSHQKHNLLIHSN